MNYQRISFDEIKNHIQNLFSVSLDRKWELMPDSIHNIAKENGVTLKWTKIERWQGFEYGFLDISSEDFLDILFQNIKPEPTEFICIVTDNCFRERLGYKVKYEDLFTFIDEIYPEIYQMDFFQPFDVIFYCRESQLLTILHHEGYYTQFQRK